MNTQKNKNPIDRSLTAKKISISDIDYINLCEIQERVLAKDHWILILKDSISGRNWKMAQSHYTWLKYNPVFSEIPPNYVIHHLDGDKLNDDPSNLVIMLRYQHSAYHLKTHFKIPETKIKLNKGLDLPKNEPSIYRRKDTKIKRYVLYWDVNGKRYSITSYAGRQFKAREDAEWAKAQIWQAPEDSEPCSMCNGRGFVFNH